MNKNFALVLSCAVSILGLASCNNKEADVLKPNDKTHTVVFQAQNPAASETKTALRLEVVPDWRETDVNDVHIFETETVGETVTTTEATHVTMEIVDEKNALFTAEFANADIIINPPKTTTKASSSTTYQYTAIMATREGDKYVVPTVQYPNEVACIDPNADMLVGRNETIFSKWIDEDQDLDLNFMRPVALARLAITNLEGEKVTMVKITTENNITGYLTYDKVDFDNKKEQEFLSDDSDKVLTLLYPGEGKKRTTTFYAYFVCVPHGVQFSKIEVYTDKYVFTKEYSTHPTLTFTAGDFMNIALDMTPKDDNGVTKTGLGSQTLSFVDGNEDPVTSVEYDLVNGKDNFVAPTLVIGTDVVDAAKVEIKSSNEKVAIVTEGVVSLVGATGEATITATVPGDDTHAAGSASYKITVTDTTAPTTVTFYKAEELEDGEKYVIVSGGKALTADLGAQDVTIENDTFEAEPDVYTLWTATAHVEYYEGTDAAGHFTLKNGEKYLQRKSNQSEQTLIVGAIPSNGKYYVWDYDGQHLDHLTLGNNTLYHYCVNYDDGWVVTSVADANNATYPTTVLYSTSKPRTKQVISFGEQPVTAKYDLNGAKWTVEVPTISGNKTDVTYSISGDESIKVNATSGEVTIENTAKKGDKATVTATAAQTDEYTSATASYTVEIIDSSAPVTATVYTLVTKEADVVDGNYLIVASADDKIFDGTGTYQGGYTVIAEAAAITRDAEKNQITIEGETTAYDFAFAKSGQGFTITGDKGMIVAAAHSGTVDSKDETYITFAETGGSVFLQRGKLTSDDKALLFSTTRGNSSNEYLYFKSSDDIFKIGGSGSTSGIHLYFAGERSEQNIAYSKATDSYDMASETAYAAPELSGDKTNVTYSSSNTNVATVDAEGVVTIKGKGETTITATAAATSELLSASASYTLTVTNSKVPTYYKVDELENGQKYLIVSNGYAIALNGTSVTAAAVTATESEGEIKFDEQDSAIWTATVSGTSIKVKNGNNYLRHSSNPTTNFSISTTDSNNGITYDADNNTVKLGSNYLYYSSGFKLSASAGDTHVAAFYSATKPLPKWEISYDVTDAEYDLYTKEWNPSKPILTSAATDVTYSSSAEDVATVSSTGEITAIKSGSTTITATATADGTHSKATAKYVLTVVNSDPDLPKYKKVTSTSDLTVGAKYLIVFEGLEGDTDGDGDPMVFKAILNSGETQFEKAKTSAQPVTIANSTIASDALGDYQFTLETGYYLKADKANKYIYPGTSGSSSVMLAESSASHALTITFDNGIAWILNGERYLVWSTSNHYFSSNTKTSSSATGICLYKLEGSGGSTPEPPTPSTYTKITTLDEMTTGSNASYLIVSDTDDKIFKGAADGTAVDVTPTSNTISGSYESYEFTVEKNDDNYYVKFKDGKYLVCDYSNTGNGTTGIRYVSSTTDVTYPYSLTVTNGAFFFETKKMDPTDAHTASQYIYFKAGTGNNIFKIGGSGSSVGVHIYKKN